MNCLGACSARPRADREYEKPTAPPYHCEPQPPFNPEFSTSHTYTRAAEGAPSASLSGVDHECLWVRAREDGDGASDGGADAPRGPRRSVYEGVDWPANDAEERVRRLEADKESLQLQVQVLSEQIAAQTEKMADLERALHDARQRIDDAEQRLQKEMLVRSSLETQKLELLSKLSEVRLRAVERGVLERSPPPEPAPASAPLARPPPPRTPPANYGRQIERNTHMYSSLPRSAPDARLAFGKHTAHNMVVARDRGHSVPNLGL